MSIYKGVRTPQGCVVTVDGESLNPRLDLCNHSPSGFEWNYYGSGPSQLSLAILAHHYRFYSYGDKMALELHQEFKREIVAQFPEEGFEMDGSQINLAVHKIRKLRQWEQPVHPGAINIIPGIKTNDH